MSSYRVILTNYHVISIALVTLGPLSLIASVFYDSVALALVGLGLTYWGIFFLYVTPTRRVRLDLLTASTASSLANTERILATQKPISNGVYLPPKYLKDYQSSLVFIPTNSSSLLKQGRAVTDTGELHSNDSKDLYLTPPGSSLCALFEEIIRKSFTDMDMNEVQKELPNLFEKLGIAKSMKIQPAGSIVSVEIGGNLFENLCRETQKFPKTHASIGCPVSSAIACVLAKAGGKPIVIEKEEQDTDQGTTKITYQMGE